MLVFTVVCVQSGGDDNFSLFICILCGVDQSGLKMKRLVCVGVFNVITIALVVLSKSFKLLSSSSFFCLDLNDN